MSLFRKKDAPSAGAAERVVSLRKTAAVSLTKNGLEADGTGGVAVYLVLDHSYSMQPFYYFGGDVQRITEQAFALAREIDSDGEVPVFYFGSGVVAPGSGYGRPDLIATDANIEGFVDRTHRTVPWGSTDYAGAIRTVRDYHWLNGANEPTLVIFQTDGSPDDRAAAERALRDVSGENLFFAFVGFGPKRNVEFLFELDKIEGRVRDNASAFHAVNPQATPDADLYDGLLKEFIRDWLPQVF
jgi:hypothetical protein